LGQHYWHSNVKGHLSLNRSSAIRYLKDVQKRHPQTVATHLEDAIQKYEAVVEVVKRIDTSHEAMSSVHERETLVDLIKGIADLERQAVAELEKAVNVLD